MSVVPSQLIAPVGMVELFMFPGETQTQVETRLQAYIDEAVDEKGSESDAATKHWAYYRAFTQVVLRLSTQAESVDVTDEGSHSYGSRQADRLRDLAGEHLAEWNALIETSSLADAPYGAVPFKPTW